MTPRIAAALLGAVLLTACSNPMAAAPTPVRLAATITPNPMTAPEAGGDIVWNLELRAAGSGSVLIQRATVRLLDAAGAVVGETNEFWSGCSVCSGEVRMNAGSSATYSGRRARYLGGGRPTRFIYTLTFVDDLGPGSTTAEVPVR
jgi:hypothetical protein